MPGGRFAHRTTSRRRWPSSAVDSRPAGRGVAGPQRRPLSGRAARIRAQRAPEVLRQPLEEKKHHRLAGALQRRIIRRIFTLVAAMNPCPCGYYNHPTKECTCSPGSVHRYLGRISGPLMDRIDLHIEVTPVSIQEMASAERARRAPRFAGGSSGPRGAGGAIQGRGRRSHQRDDEQRDGARILPDRREARTLLERAMERLSPLGTGLRPHPEGGAHDRRSGGTSGHGRRTSPRRSTTGR